MALGTVRARQTRFSMPKIVVVLSSGENEYAFICLSVCIYTSLLHSRI